MCHSFNRTQIGPRIYLGPLIALMRGYSNSSFNANQSVCMWIFTVSVVVCSICTYTAASSSYFRRHLSLEIDFYNCTLLALINL